MMYLAATVFPAPLSPLRKERQTPIYQMVHANLLHPLSLNEQTTEKPGRMELGNGGGEEHDASCERWVSAGPVHSSDPGKHGTDRTFIIAIVQRMESWGF